MHTKVGQVIFVSRPGTGDQFQKKRYNVFCLPVCTEIREYSWPEVEHALNHFKRTGVCLNVEFFNTEK